MDRTIVQTRLAHTEVQIADGEHQVAEQRDAIDLLECGGQPTKLAKYQLAGLLLLQGARREDRNRLLKELDELGMKR